MVLEVFEYRTPVEFIATDSRYTRERGNFQALSINSDNYKHIIVDYEQLFLPTMVVRISVLVTLTSRIL